MDKLRLEIRAMDEVNDLEIKCKILPDRQNLMHLSLTDHFPWFQIQPDLRELMETMNRMSNMPPDSEAKDKVSLW